MECAWHNIAGMGKAVVIMGIWEELKKRRRPLFVLVILGIFTVALGTGIHSAVRTAGETAATVVIDPGHGGIDPGKVGVDGSYEKEINLGISNFLKEALEKKGCRVIMTRERDEGLYQETDTNKKIADLQKRTEIMNQDGVDLIVSVHQNSFSGSSTKGAQVFYHSGSAQGEQLAKILQAQLASSLNPDNHRQAKANSEYYILKNTKNTAVIAECGFLSNAEEAALLGDTAYQKKVASAIAEGVSEYLKAVRKDQQSAPEK